MKKSTQELLDILKNTPAFSNYAEQEEAELIEVSLSDYLNRLTAKACQKKVCAGPIEATAIGNISAQMIAAGELENLKTARECIYHSFDIAEYEV